MPRFILGSEYAVIALRGLEEFSSSSVRTVFQQFLRSVEWSSVRALIVCSSTYGVIDGEFSAPGCVPARRTVNMDNLSFVTSQIASVGKPVFGVANGLVDNIDFHILKHTDEVFAFDFTSFSLGEPHCGNVLVQELVNRVGWQAASRVAASFQTISASMAAHLGIIRAVIKPGEWDDAFFMHAAAKPTQLALTSPPPMYGPFEPVRKVLNHPLRPQRVAQERPSSSPFPSAFFQPPPKKTTAAPVAQQAGAFAGGADAWPSLIDGQPITTVMIRSLPPAVTLEMLMDALDMHGLKDKYDFAHIPSSGKLTNPRSTNLGYGFVNFTEARSAVECAKIFTDYKFFPTEDKTCSVHPAVKQGREANMAHIMRFTSLHPSRMPYSQTKQNVSINDCDGSTDAGSEWSSDRPCAGASVAGSSDEGDVASGDAGSESGSQAYAPQAVLAHFALRHGMKTAASAHGQMLVCEKL